MARLPNALFSGQDYEFETHSLPAEAIADLRKRRPIGIGKLKAAYVLLTD